MEGRVHALVALVQASGGVRWVPWLHAVATNAAGAASIGVAPRRTHPALAREVAVAIGDAS